LLSAVKTDNQYVNFSPLNCCVMLCQPFRDDYARGKKCLEELFPAIVLLEARLMNKAFPSFVKKPTDTTVPVGFGS